MSDISIARSLVVVFATGLLLCLGTVTASAATLTLDFSVSFGDPLDADTAPPDGPAPWLTAEFVDTAPDAVELTLTVASTVGIADVTEIYLNVDDNIGGGNLSFFPLGGTGPVASISAGTDAFKADADGWFDILLDLPPPGGDRFEAGETLIYEISGAGLNALSFNFGSTPDPVDPNGPFLGAAKFQSTGSGSVFCAGGTGACSDWVGVAVPVPAAAWLFGSALALLGWTRRGSLRSRARR